MTKQEKIKEAYGEYYEHFKPYLQENGELALSNIDSELWEIVDELDFVSFRNGYSTLKSLQGIEDNNGWIKIESEEDLPKNVIDCWFKTDSDYILLGYFSTRNFFVNDGNDVELRFVTHYQPIEKPQPPIY